jgi:protein-tyrosine kinase
MLMPKASHLVERVAERLLESEALDESALQVLRRNGAEEPHRTAASSTDHSLTAPPERAAAGTLVGQPITASAAIVKQARAAGDAAIPKVEQNDAETAVTSASDVSMHGLIPASTGISEGPSSIDAISLERAGMMDWSRTRTRISEEFRLVQRQIIRSAFGPGAEPGFSNLLLVTSARPREGKSFMASNLAGSIARQGGHHVLLVDADSKRDSICYSLGLAAGPRAAGSRLMPSWTRHR